MKTPAWLHNLASITALCTLLLLCLGALVTSTGSGLSVPDWPLSYGQVFPAMVGGVLYEHGHRLFAGSVAMLTIVQAFLFWRYEPRGWVRGVSYASVLTVLAQASLGGLTVILRLPPAVSVGHACLAQLFFSTTVVLALVTSQNWFHTHLSDEISQKGISGLPTFCAILSVGFFLQLLAGAIMRHTGAGLAIPDFPTAFGGFIPPFVSPAVVIHFIHRMGAFTMAGASLVAVVWIYRKYPLQFDLVALAGGLISLVSVQIMLGAMIIWLRRPVAFTTVHLAVGASCLATSIALTVKTFRLRSLIPWPKQPTEINIKTLTNDVTSMGWGHT